MTRLEFFKKNMSYSKLYEHYKGVDFDEFVVDRWGDVCKFRVYGNNIKNYIIIEK